MCGILDANCVHEAFGNKRTEAGIKFFDWVNSGKGRLVVGGKLWGELNDSSTVFSKWARDAQLKGVLVRCDDQTVQQRTIDLVGRIRSNDAHIIALAMVSGARLLYSNDIDLHKDFKSAGLLDDPRGKVYSTIKNKKFKDSHKRLLRNPDLCAQTRKK